MLKKLRVDIENQQKAYKIPTGLRMLIRRCCHAVLELEQVDGSVQVDVTLVDNDRIHQVNLEQRNIDAPTDVLSFPLGENGVYDVHPETGEKLLGNIMISLEQAAKQAEDYGHSFNREVGYLTVHSMLHLLGYDHVQGGMEAVRMREKEETVMKQVGLPRGSSYVLEDD
ncbi:MAG: rRNA maturation RNase YbeY [Clostridia bacterium]|nr:rRNA maturation RNase YbeY [Clostridia bacterium]